MNSFLFTRVISLILRELFLSVKIKINLILYLNLDKKIINVIINKDNIIYKKLK